MMSISKIIRTHRQFWSVSDDEGEALQDQLDAGEDVTSRRNWRGHITASALVVDAGRSRILFIKSIKFGKLLLPGGHLEQGESPLVAAQRELTEETGVSRVSLFRFHPSAFIPIEINTHRIVASSARCEPTHLHHDFIYTFFIVDNFDPAIVLNNESSMIDWYGLETLTVSYPKAFSRLIKKLGEIR